VRASPTTCTGNELTDAVAVEISNRYGHTAGEERIVGRKAREFRHGAAGEAPRAHVGAAARTRARHELRHAVAVQIACGNRHPAAKRRVVREEPCDLRETAPDQAPHAHVR
jgi:hypothetical protein